MDYLLQGRRALVTGATGFIGGHMDHYASPGVAPGREGWNLNRNVFRDTFPDLHFEEHWGNGDDLGMLRQRGAVP
jgi:nucleoside-diphosphate-sugar epimerase